MSMLKSVKTFLLLFSVLMIAFSFNAYAQITVSLPLDDEFAVFPEDTDTLSEILNMSSDDISLYCTENNIVYLAVDQSNSRQIRVSVFTNDFSNEVVNISRLSGDKITQLTEDIVGTKGIRGEIVNKNGQKFLKIQLRSDDSGGGYILTQYITVANRKNIILSFYNSEDVNIDYIQKAFEGYSSPLFINEEANQSKILYYIIPIAILILLVIIASLGVSIVKDLKSVESDEYYEEDDQETTDTADTEEPSDKT